ncbi:class I SAM-dependent methyltransferase, partial [bacterium]|nr:class I SAM-dependent methyltransferase [bacterium]
MFISQEDEIKLRDSESKEYADWVKNTRGYWFYAQQSAVKNLMKFKKSDVVLDAGCGVGLHTIPYSRYVDHITAVDFSQGIIDVLTRKLLESSISNVTVCSGDLTDLRLGDEIFDKSYAVGVIQHIPTYEQRVKALTNIHRSLKENGIFLMECY